MAVRDHCYRAAAHAGVGSVEGYYEMEYLGYCLAALAIVLILWMLFNLLIAISIFDPSVRKVEQVDIIEGGSIVEQQRWGRERWRHVEVEIPTRPLSYEEDLNLRSILESGNGNVRVVGNDEE